MTHQPKPRPHRAVALAAVLALAAALGTTGPAGTTGTTGATAPAAGPPAAPLRLSGAGECTFPMKKQTAGRPWALQRLLLDELWAGSKGKDVRVAVIDTGVDRVNPQLSGALDVGSGKDFIDGKGDGTNDTVGHGTKVAGLIAARPNKGTGFVGLAPEATIIPIRQNDGQGKGNAETLGKAIDHAVDKGAHIINISQDTDAPLGENSALGQAVKRAVDKNVLIVASAGNDGLNGQKRKTYPAAYPKVLAVGASDRNNERAAFSQPGTFLAVAAPGVDMLSTVPGFGQCVDNGTSFSAPYVAGVAALLKAQHKDWTPEEIIWQIQQTAERSVKGRDDYVGWGVVDPVRAVTQDHERPRAPVPDPGPPPAAAPDVAPLQVTETAQEREERLGTYALGAAAVLIAVIAGTAVVVRDARNRRRRLQ
ncbi:type VII secretion-associated serine protease mycosin [Streptomyces sp. NPDC048603]|uniref:type VII secretion-associated serine protease mycosin n=1 Tax=Streptomyces sp. NPDC048603 TaxID=3365577 RepID=UPI00372054D1